MTLPWGWMADLVLAGLLIATLAMSVRLDRALRVVRRDRAAFEALITSLGSATASVKLGIGALRQEAERAAEQIDTRSQNADKMATDLSFLIDAAERASARIEAQTRELSEQRRPIEHRIAGEPSPAKAGILDDAVPEQTAAGPCSPVEPIRPVAAARPRALKALPAVPDDLYARAGITKPRRGRKANEVRLRHSDTAIGSGGSVPTLVEPEPAIAMVG
jgi:hypothetical protein